MEVERPTKEELKPSSEFEIDKDLNKYDSDFEGPYMPRESGAFEDETGYYEVPFCGCLSYEVDTSDVVYRLAKSLIFFSPTLVESIKTVPDLYGPFWIYTTLAFMLGITANVDASMNKKDPIGRAFFYVYFVGFLAPIGISICLRSTGQRVYPVKIITIYGYSYFVYLLVTFVALVPQNSVKLGALVYAGVTSLVHLVVSLTHEVKKQTTSGRTLAMVVLYVLLVQPLALFLFKDKFFHHIRLEF